MTLLTLEQAAELPVESVGGKAKGLAHLAALGLPVPAARVLDSSAHARYVESGSLDTVDWDALEQAARDLGGPLAVRSSAADEDAEGRSAAGQYESIMGVEGIEELAAAVARCYDAGESERARAYRGNERSAVALVIQREVRAQRAGVAFSIDPVSRSTDVVLEAVFGHGEGMVSGEISPDRYRVPRGDGAVRSRVADKTAASDGRGRLHEIAGERRLTRVLRDDEVRRVARLALEAEQGFGKPVDLEFCWDGPDLWLVQCRPITSLDGAP